MHIKLAVHVEIAVFTVNRATRRNWNTGSRAAWASLQNSYVYKVISYIAVCDLMITLSYITISCNPIDLFEIYIGYN